MRIGLTTKLLLALGFTSAVSVLAMGLAARWSFQHGFLDYLGEQELKRVAPVEEALVRAYDELGSWNSFERDPRSWPRFVDDALAPDSRGPLQYSARSPNSPEGQLSQTTIRPMRPPGDSHQPLQSDIHDVPAFQRPGGPPPDRYDARPFAPPDGPLSDPFDARSFTPPSGPPPDPYGAGPFAPPDGPPHDLNGARPFAPFSGPGFAPPPPRPGGLGRRLRLLDVQGQPVAGGPPETGDELLESLESGGVVVGWLALSPPHWLEDELAQRFYSQHNRSLLWIALGVLTLAILLGLVFGEGIRRRIRTLTEGGRRLVAGDHGTRITPEGRDELAGLAEDFNHLAAALERNEELRRRAMADVSHELRTPMAVARAELDALIDGVRPCDKERLEQLQGRLMALTRLLDDLYELALSDAGALDYRHGPMDLSEILEAAVSETRDAFADKGVELRLECDDALPMEGDCGRLRQVLDNLLGNSLRYTDAGGFTRVMAAREGAEIRVSVSDTPPGVDQEVLERLFDRFYRVDASRSRARGGAGLGLAICRNIVEAHRGEICARAADSGGLAVDIRLPASRYSGSNR